MVDVKQCYQTHLGKLREMLPFLTVYQIINYDLKIWCDKHFLHFLCLYYTKCLSLHIWITSVHLQISLSSGHLVFFAHWTDMGHPPCPAEVSLWELPIRVLHIWTKHQHSTLHQVNSLWKTRQYYYVFCDKWVLQVVTPSLNLGLCLSRVSQ